MLKFIRATLPALVLLATPALAQTAAPPQQQQVDPRTAGPTIEAQGALLKLREAEIRALAQDSQKKVDELEAKVKDLAAKLKAAQPASAEPAKPADAAPAPAEPAK